MVNFRRKYLSDLEKYSQKYYEEPISKPFNVEQYARIIEEKEKRFPSFAERDKGSNTTSKSVKEQLEAINSFEPDRKNSKHKGMIYGEFGYERE
jgi:hypothetical protein